MHCQTLTTGWTLKVHSGPNVPQEILGREISAAVPGCVHTNLLDAGLIPDPYLSDNEDAVQWIGRSDCSYFCTFAIAATLLEHDRVELVCQGLDTVAEISLNGLTIGSACNMHRPHRFDVKPSLRAGDNVLAIAFKAPVSWIEEMERLHGHLPHTGHGSNTPRPHNQIRKMACNFGWDWGPDLATYGIWRPIYIQAWNGVRIDAVRPLVLVATESLAKVDIHIDLDPPVALPDDARVSLFDPDGGHVAEALRVSHGWHIEVPQPRRWWPIGHGTQPLYTLDIIVGADRWKKKIGLRSCSLRTEPDSESGLISGKQGESMTIVVNGKPIYCKGANWVPDDCFPNRVTPQRYRQRLTQARDANMNMIRVWGGGLYESEEFYSLCDELGLLVWQDFAFACAFYSEDEPMWSEVEAEARHQIARLCSHPSLVVWNGCNENIWGATSWAGEWQRIKCEPMTTWGLGYYLSLLPKLMKELDPSRPYWPASPYSGSFDRPPNANEFGNRHVWDVWHGPGQYRNYLSHYPRLATEFGFHGPPTWLTLARVIPPEQRRWDSPIMVLHNKNGGPGLGGQDQCGRRMADDFDPPTSPERFDDWLYLAQVMQARALEMGVTWFRALFPWNSGALYWQLNDCYPVSSWSAIDGDGRAKPLWYATRRFFAPRIVTIKPARVMTGDEPPRQLAAYLHNDDDQLWSARCVVRRMGLSGPVLDEHAMVVSVAPRSSHPIELPAKFAEPSANEFIVAEAVGGERGFWWFAPDKEMTYPKSDFRAELGDRQQGAQTLIIQARTLLRDLCVFADRLHPEATVSDQLLTLLPGESVAIVIRSPIQCSLAALTNAPVLNVANRFGRQGMPRPDG